MIDRNLVVGASRSRDSRDAKNILGEVELNVSANAACDLFFSDKRGSLKRGEERVLVGNRLYGMICNYNSVVVDVLTVNQAREEGYLAYYEYYMLSGNVDLCQRLIVVLKQSLKVCDSL